jgi:ribosome maturation factor RimP
VERLSQGQRSSLIRVYIDKANGISLSDCEKVSHQISGLLDVEDPIQGHYILEVSSPGLDIPLFTLDHFVRFIGYKVNVKLSRPLQARRTFTGILQRVEDHIIVIVVADGKEYNLPYEQIDKARLVPEEPLVS